MEIKKINLLVCFLILTITTSVQSQDKITVDKIWAQYEYAPKRIPGFNFLKDGKGYSRLRKNKIITYDLVTGKESSVILDGGDLKSADGFDGDIDSYTFNDDESKILIQSDRESIYRRSSKAYFYLYDRSDQSLKEILSGEKIMYATLSPDDSMIAYVWKNNMYVYDLQSDKTTQITEDGVQNEIINGSADWVYEEEFSMSQAFSWSPDSKYIAFLKFDESRVKEFTMTNYRNELYPEYVTFKYPKVGEDNAIVTAHLYNVDNKKKQKLNISNDIEYIPRVKWTTNPSELIVYTLNRHQNHLQLISFDVASGSQKVLLEEKSKYYIELHDNVRFLDNGDFVWTSESNGYNHIYLYDKNGRLKKQLTDGQYDVFSFYGVDQQRGKVYYQAAENSAIEKHVYEVSLDGQGKRNLTPSPGTHSAQFSSTYDYFVDTYSTANKPASYVVLNNDLDTVRVIEENKKLKSKMKSYGVSPVEFLEVPTPAAKLNAWMIKPPNFNKDSIYPVFMYLYGGPGSQQVTDSWKGQNFWWFQQMAQEGYLIVCVDNRGTGARGEEFKKMTYMQLGHYETIDQIEAAKYVGGLPYADAERIGIFGWSYGGYMSSLCLLKGNDVFKAAIAVAPVTSWRWYDTIYTERYMRTEEENPDGYADNSPVNFAEMLKGNYLLIHGMGDDNVHFQNSVEMANALISANKQFDTYYYPNRHHGIVGDNARRHLYKKMTEFLLEKL